MKGLFDVAVAAAKVGKGERHFSLGAVAIRQDGVWVTAHNGSPPGPEPRSHAEQRCLRKAGQGAILIVCRVRRDGTLGLAYPCAHCRAAIKAKKVKQVWYSTGDWYYNRGFDSYIP